MVSLSCDSIFYYTTLSLLMKSEQQKDIIKFFFIFSVAYFSNLLPEVTAFQFKPFTLKVTISSRNRNSHNTSSIPVQSPCSKF